MEQYCVINQNDLLRIRQSSKLESLLKSFHCFSKFHDDKIESPDFWITKMLQFLDFI